jgi:hypothetical protein
MSASARRIAGTIGTGVPRLGILARSAVFLVGAAYYVTQEPPGRDAGLMILVFGACVLLPSLKAETKARRRRRRVPRERG